MQSSTTKALTTHTANTERKTLPMFQMLKAICILQSRIATKYLKIRKKAKSRSTSANTVMLWATAPETSEITGSLLKVTTDLSAAVSGNTQTIPSQFLTAKADTTTPTAEISTTSPTTETSVLTVLFILTELRTQALRKQKLLISPSLLITTVTVP